MPKANPGRRRGPSGSARICLGHPQSSEESVQSPRWSPKKNALFGQARGSRDQAAKLVGKMGLFLGGPVENHANFFQRDQTAFHHFVQTRKNLLDPFGRFDYFDDDGKVLRQAKNFVGMVDA